MFFQKFNRTKSKTKSNFTKSSRSKLRNRLKCFSSIWQQKYLAYFIQRAYESSTQYFTRILGNIVFWDFLILHSLLYFVRPMYDYSGKRGRPKGKAKAQSKAQGIIALINDLIYIQQRFVPNVKRFVGQHPSGSTNFKTHAVYVSVVRFFRIIVLSIAISQSWNVFCSKFHMRWK